jgi:phage FluMu protein Com
MPRNPGESEGEYFARIEFEQKKKIEREKRQSLAREEKKQLRDLHYMKCPKCGMDLIEVDYKSVRMDKCPGCEGVWLDAGELNAVTKMDKSMLDRIFGMFPG